MANDNACSIRIHDTATAYLFRVVGRGTRLESAAVRDFVCGALDDGANVLIDLNDCEHLDSTFLGCLVMLQRHGDRAQGNFQLYANEPTRQRLFGICRLDQILSFTDRLPDGQGSAVVLPVPNLPRREYCEHLLDTHRQLAELGGPSAETFQRIVDQLKSELDRL